jgi:peroxiredoxin-like protein
MHPLPHIYNTNAQAASEGLVTITAQDLPDLSSAPPKEFDGPGDQWSPETLLLAAVADCYVLSFRAAAAAAKFEWHALECKTEGTLDRIERVTRFTSIVNTVTLTVSADASEDRAQSLLEKAEKICLISNSLNAELHLITHILRA